MLLQFQHVRATHTVVIGAGPTGLATSYLLKQQGIPHVLLEQSMYIASSWRYLWDNYKLAMKAEDVNMPGMLLNQIIPGDQHPSRDQMIAFFEHYAEHHKLPIQFATSVLAVKKKTSRQFEVRANSCTYICENVVCCVGPRHQAKFPFDIQPLRALPELQVMHSREYRSCKFFPAEGMALVVGSGVGALSIAYDIFKQGYPVELACAHTQEAIVSSNQHLYGCSDVEIVPTLDSLQAKGLINHGRLQAVIAGELIFTQGDQNERLPYQRYAIIIFATGFQTSYKLLKDLLPESVTEYANGISNIPGLYIAGIPAANEQTVIISQGSQHASEIVTKMVTEQSTPVAIMRNIVAKY